MKKENVHGGTMLTRKPPRDVETENCSIARSAKLTKGSNPSRTSYPWEIRNIIAPAVLIDGLASVDKTLSGLEVI